MLKLNVNYLKIIKVHLAVSLNAKFVFLLRKLTFFKNKDKSEMFDTREGTLNCNSNLIVYLIECKSCSKQYVAACVSYPF